MKNTSPPQYDNVTYLEPYQGFRVKILFRCTVCNHEWRTSPQVVQQANRKGFNGCPNCQQIRKYGHIQAANKTALPSHIIADPEWTGTRSFVHGKFWFTNTNCGHRFETYPNDILLGRIDCPVCGEEGRVNDLKQRNKARRTDQNYDAWMEYKNRASYQTHKTYKANKELLNPHDYPITLCGVPGGYQIDHLLPRSVAYKLGISEEEVSHVDNLQVISWEDNRQHSATIKFIPLIFRQYFTSEYLEVNSIVIDDLTSFEFESEDGLH